MSTRKGSRAAFVRLRELWATEEYYTGEVDLPEARWKEEARRSKARIKFTPRPAAPLLGKQ